MTFMTFLIIFLLILFLATKWFMHVDTGLGLGTFRSFSTTTTLTAIDHTVVFNGANAATAKLPDAMTCKGRFYSISNSSNTIPTPTLTIAPKMLQKIDGQTVYSLALADESILLMSDGANWKILTKFIPPAIHSPSACSSVSYVNASSKRNSQAPVFYDISIN